jgi:uncharacterized protein YkwD
VLKLRSTFFSAILIFIVLAMVCSAILVREGQAQSSASSFNAQSAGDPNRPPIAQSSQRSAQHVLLTSKSSAVPYGDDEILFDHVNESRVLTGLPVLRWDANLAAAAKKHCALMVQHAALSHQFPGEQGLKERVRDAGAEFTVVAENVALAPTPDEIHDEWMHSPPHRANILDPELTSIGIAEMPGNRGLYAVQDFSRAVENLTLPEQEEKVRALISEGGVRTADNPERTQWSDARKTCQMTSGYAGNAAAYVKFDSADLSQLPGKLKTLLASGKYRAAAVGACNPGNGSDGFTRYKIAVLLY